MRTASGVALVCQQSRRDWDHICSFVLIFYFTRRRCCSILQLGVQTHQKSSSIKQGHHEASTSTFYIESPPERYGVLFLASAAHKREKAFYKVFQPCAQVLGARRSSEDAATSVLEDQWYWARDDWGYLSGYCGRWDRKGGHRHLQCLDVFSASRRFQQIFQSHGHHASAFDIKNDRKCDITTKEGFMLLLHLGLQKLVGMQR